MTTTPVMRRLAACALAMAGSVAWSGDGAVAQVPAAQRPAVQGQPATRPQAPPAAGRSQAPIVPIAPIAPPPVAQSAPAPPAAQTPAGQPGGGETIARVAGMEIKADEVRVMLAALGPQEQAAVARDPSLLSQIVRATLANQLVLREALARKWDQQPQVAAQLQRARDNALAESYLRSVTASPADYPGDADVQSVYDANKTAFLVPRQFQLAQIFVAVAKDADKAAEDKARRKLDDIEKKVKAPGADFAAIAKADSDERESAEQGGEIGTLAEAQLRPEIRAQVIGLAKDAVAEPLRLDDGWHILKLIDTRPAYSRPLEEVRDAVVQRLRAERVEANRRAYLADLLKQNPPAINELALTKLVQPAER